MLKRKNVVCLILSLILVLSLFGCTQTPATETGVEQSGDTPTSPASDENTSDTSAESVEPVELTFWEMLWGPTDTWTEAVENLVAKFNEEHPNIKVNVQIIPWDNYYQQFLTAVTSGAAPDVSTGAFQQGIQYAAMDEILDLSSIVEEWKADGTYDDFLPGSIELHQYNGIQAGIPWNADPRVITYRKDILEQAGVTEEDMPKSWDEFMEVCRKIKENTDAIPFSVIGVDQNSNHTMLNFMFTNGIGMCDKDGNPTFNDPKVVETLEFFGTMLEEGLLAKGSAGYKVSDLDQMLVTGKLAMGFYNVTRIAQSDPEAGPQLRIMPPFPAEEGGTPRCLNWVNPIVAYKQTEHPEECKIFIKWWIENGLSLFTDGKAEVFPARQSFMDDPYYDDIISQECAEYINPNGTSAVWPMENLFTAFAQIDGENYIGKPLQEVLTGKTDYQAIADKYNEMIKNAIAESE